MIVDYSYLVNQMGHHRRQEPMPARWSKSGCGCLRTGRSIRASASSRLLLGGLERRCAPGEGWGRAPMKEQRPSRVFVDELTDQRGGLVALMKEQRASRRPRRWVAVQVKVAEPSDCFCYRLSRTNLSENAGWRSRYLERGG